MKLKNTKKNIFGLAIVLFVITIFLTSCQKDFKEAKADDKAQQLNSAQRLTENIAGRLGLPYQEGTIVLGDQLRNPYTPTLMSQAWNNLQSRGVTSLYPVEIRQTHFYIKFKPRTWDEYDDLKEDSLLHISDIPYDYEIVKNGNFYQDPTINDTLPTYQYATVPAGFDFNDTIAYEVLSPLYIPEKDNQLLGPSNQNEPFLDKLLNEAYTLTGNYEDTIDLNQQSSLNRYVPGGNIQLFDTRLNTNYGFQGVKVTARRWFDVLTAFCDLNGNYRMNGSFKRPCNYSIWYEHGRFFVKRSGVHWINGPKQIGDWNHTVADGFDRFAGHIFRAAFRYHYKEIGGLQRPFRWLGRKTDYVAKDGVGTGTNPIIFRGIKIWRFRDLAFNEYLSDEIFSTTSHETAHTSHAIRMNTVFQFWQVSRQLQESWAVAVEWFLAHLEYADRGIANYGEFAYFPPNPPDYPNSYAYQYWTPDGSQFLGRYTPIYIDIVDNHNQLGINYFERGIGFVNDQVNGYSLPEIEAKLLKHIYGLSSLASELKNNKPVGVTDAQIDLLISHF